MLRNKSSQKFRRKSETEPGIGSLISAQTDLSEKDSSVAEKVSFFFPPTILMLIVFLLYVGARFVSQMNWIRGANPYLSIGVIQICIYVVPCVFYCMFQRDTGFSAYRFRPFRLYTVPFLITGTLLLFVLIVVLKYITIYLFQIGDSTISSLALSDDLIYTLLVGAALPAVTEEILLRGVLFSGYNKVAGGAGAVFMTSLLFAMLHFSPENFVVYFGAGLVLGCVTLVTGSVIPAMVLHFVSNLTMILSERSLFRIANENVGGILALVLLAAGLLILTIIALYQAEGIYIKKALQKPSVKEPNEPIVVTEHRFFPVLAKIIFSPVFILLTAIFLIVSRKQ